MRWPIHHTCHNLSLPKFTPKLIEFGPLTKRGEWQEQESGLRICPICESLHPEDLYNAMVDGRATIHLTKPDEWPSRFMVRGLGGVHPFVTFHLGDYGYGPAELRAFCSELSRGQPHYVLEPDVDGVHWRRKADAEGVVKIVRKLSKILKPERALLALPVCVPEVIPEEDPKALGDWQRKMEAEVQAFRKERRGW